MPIYEYDCRECEKRFETLVRSRDEKVACPECGGEQVERAWSTFHSKQGVSTPASCPAATPT
jgi:putative FmdB family regulatory protein